MSKIDELLKNEKVEWKKLGEVCEFQRGQAITKKDIIDGKIPVIAGGKKPAYYHDISNRNGITIAVAGSGAYAGFVSYWEQPIFLSDAFSVEPNESLNKRYLYHWLLSVQHKIFELKQGSGIPHVYGKDLGRFEIPIPSIETQEKIVKILDKFTNYVTELQTELQKRTKQYEYYRDMLLSEEYLNMVSEKIFMQSNNIVKKFKLIEIVELNRGKRVVKSELAENAKYPVFQNSLTPLGYYDYKNFEGGKTCIITAGAAGEIFYQDKDFWAADDVFVLTTNNILNKYLYYFLLNKQCLLKSKVRKASIPRLSRDDIEKIEILFPSIEIQNKVVQILDKFQSLLSDTKGLLPQEIEQRQKQYEYYREKLLTFDENCVKRERAYLSNSYLNTLKEAADIVGVKLFDTKLERIENCVLNVEKIKWNDSQASSFNYIDLSSVVRENHNISNTDIITMKNAPSRAQQVVHMEDVLFGTTRPLLQRYCIIPNQYDKQICSTGFCVLRANKEKVLPKWLLYGISTTSFLSYIEKYEKGTSYPAISDKDVKLYEIPLPSLSVQAHIVSILDKFDTIVNDISKGLPKEIELRQKQYEYYREKLLTFER